MQASEALVKVEPLSVVVWRRARKDALSSRRFYTSGPHLRHRTFVRCRGLLLARDERRA